MKTQFTSSFYSSVLLLMLTFSLASRAQTQLAPISVHAEEQDSSEFFLGFEEFRLREIPVSSESISEKDLQQKQIYRLSDITKVDASTTDSYNATGYWDMMSVRGFTLDNRSNYYREGLPINAETSIPLENKASIDVLKGLSGVQAGASSPGGQINYTIKRPTVAPLREVRSDVTDSGNLLLAADVAGPVSGHQQFGYRFNLAQEMLSPHLKDSRGERSLVSAAGEWRISESQLLEAEIEWSRRSQPSQAGFSLLGSRLPDVGDPDLNLNNQSWTRPVVFRGLTGSLRYTQSLASSWSWSAALGLQGLGTDDHLAYPYGCSKENNFDRYCSDGTFDMYDFRSDNESRETRSLKVSLQGQAQTKSIRHALNFALMGWGTRERFERQAYNLVGEGNVEGTAQLPANGTLNDQSTNRDAGNLLFSVNDAMSFGAWKAWLGLSFNYLQRDSVRTDGTRKTDFSQSFPIPWAALSYNFEKVMAYVSYGEGLESFVTPNKSGYAHPGEYLKDVRSRQMEVGVRGGKDIVWGAALFQIDHPVVTDQAPAYEVDGEARHRGLELEATAKLVQWEFDASVMFLQATREDSDLNPSLNGKKPLNVPEQTLRLGAGYYFKSAPGLSANARIIHEGTRAVVSDNSIMLPAWTRLDAGLSYVSKWGSVPTTVRFFAENLANTRYWRESPTQYGHIYLYPGESRFWGLSLIADL
ncbi:MAG: TonB-dependent siderophore receptor [Bdellovibrio sp.]|nr:TonB-dependent siderophore receptor [Bdellovibrio sp.]